MRGTCAACVANKPMVLNWILTPTEPVSTHALLKASVGSSVTHMAHSMYGNMHAGLSIHPDASHLLGVMLGAPPGVLLPGGAHHRLLLKVLGAQLLQLSGAVRLLLQVQVGRLAHRHVRARLRLDDWGCWRGAWLIEPDRLDEWEWWRGATTAWLRFDEREWCIIRHSSVRSLEAQNDQYVGLQHVMDVTTLHSCLLPNIAI